MNCLPETSTDPNTFPFPLRSGIGAEVRRGDLWPVPVDETQLANLQISRKYGFPKNSHAKHPIRTPFFTAVSPLAPQPFLLWLAPPKRQCDADSDKTFFLSCRKHHHTPYYPRVSKANTARSRFVPSPSGIMTTPL